MAKVNRENARTSAAAPNSVRLTLKMSMSDTVREWMQTNFGAGTNAGRCATAGVLVGKALSAK
jgi:hypothetical protein